jgi:hypothetical protein
MNNRYLTLTEDSPEILKGCLWALAIGSVLILFVFTIWLGVQRAEILVNRRSLTMAGRQRDAAYAEKNAAIQSCNARLANVELARMAAENQAQTALQAKAQAEAECAQAKALCGQYEREVTALRAALARARY